MFHRFGRAQATAYALNNVAWTARAVGDATSAAPCSTTRWSASARSRTTRRGHDAQPHGQPRALGGRHRGRPRPSGRRTRAAPRSGREARVPMSTMSLGVLEVSVGELARGRELLAEAFARASAVDDMPAMAGVRTNSGSGRGASRRARARRAAARRRARAVERAAAASVRGLGGDRALGGARGTRRRAGAQPALDAPGSSWLAARTARPMRYLARSVAKRVQRRRFVAWPTHPIHQETP